LLVQEGVEARFIAKLKRRMATLRVGPSLDKTVDMGAIVDPVQLARIESLVQAGRREGCDVWQPSEVVLPNAGGSYYPPTLVTNVAPACTLAQEEIFGPVLTAMSFRTPEEAVALANNTRYGLAASVWSETIGRALDIAPRLACGVVWVNATNLFDASVGFGGYRESGYGREGGREGAYEYLKPAGWGKGALREASAENARSAEAAERFSDRTGGTAFVDRTAKLFIGGKQARADGGNSRAVHAPNGALVGEIADGNRKDVRDAVSAARGATKWTQMSGHARAQVLYFLAENLSARADEFAGQLERRTQYDAGAAEREVDASISRLFTYAAWADKYDGAVHTPPLRGVALAMPEALGVVGIACPDEAPLLALISLIGPALALGNRVVALPSEACPLMATDLYQIVETSDVPAGTLNIVTGARDTLLPALAKHDDVDALWCFGLARHSTLVECESIGNLKRTFVDYGRRLDWFDRATEGMSFLRHAAQVKNIWIPYGD
jgi:aldehyde dehydrogenase (NAD+)